MNNLCSQKGWTLAWAHNAMLGNCCMKYPNYAKPFKPLDKFLLSLPFDHHVLSYLLVISCFNSLCLSIFYIISMMSFSPSSSFAAHSCRHGVRSSRVPAGDAAMRPWRSGPKSLDLLDGHQKRIEIQNLIMNICTSGGSILPVFRL